MFHFGKVRLLWAGLGTFAIMYQFVALGGEAQILNDWCTNLLSEFTFSYIGKVLLKWLEPEL